MMFENDLSPEPTWRTQLVAHIPIVLLALGIAGTMLALHTALAGVAALAIAHVLVGGVIVGVRRHRAQAASQ